MSGTRREMRQRFEQEALPHLDALYTAAFHLTRSQDDADDLCQETLLRGYRFFDQFVPGTNCRAWLLAILYNAFRRSYARAKREQVSGTWAEFQHLLENHCHANEGGLPSLDTDAISERDVRQALADLPEPAREILLLIDIQGLSYDEAAKVLQVPTGTVRSRLSRSRALMRQALRRTAPARRIARA